MSSRSSLEKASSVGFRKRSLFVVSLAKATQNENLCCENSFVPENGHALYGVTFHADENGRSQKSAGRVG